MIFLEEVNDAEARFYWLYIPNIAGKRSCASLNLLIDLPICESQAGAFVSSSCAIEHSPLSKKVQIRTGISEQVGSAVDVMSSIPNHVNGQ